MTKSHLVAAIAGSLLVAVLVVPSLAQGPPVTQGTYPPRANVQSAAGKVALLDVKYVLENHTRFQGQMANLKAEAERARELMKAESETIRNMIGELKKLPTGSQPYKEMEEHVAKRQADLEIQMRLQNKDFLQKEAKQYHTVYQEVQQEVAYYAAQVGIVAVFSFNGEPANEDQPDEILREINNPVVWYARDTDITDMIVKRIEARAGGGGSNRVTRQPTQQGVPAPQYNR